MAAQLCVALDGSNRSWIVDMAARVGPASPWLKIGLEAFVAFGPPLVRDLADDGRQLFLDLKLHDIPTTVARAAANAARLGVALVNVHAGGGRAMMAAAAAAVRDAGGPVPTRVIAVTVLTSLDDEALRDIGHHQRASDLVRSWACLAQDCGLDGVVCSAREAATLRQACGPEFLLVTPGIRPADAEPGDQRRIVTPSEAAALGIDLAVVGRPITGAQDPAAVARRIAGQLAGR
jgi:orotidine-5'-phosphate decarboxylase